MNDKGFAHALKMMRSLDQFLACWWGSMFEPWKLNVHARERSTVVDYRKQNVRSPVCVD